MVKDSQITERKEVEDMEEFEIVEIDSSDEPVTNLLTSGDS